jgi:hypothetical protein
MFADIDELNKYLWEPLNQLQAFDNISLGSGCSRLLIVRGIASVVLDTMILRDPWEEPPRDLASCQNREQ